MRRRTLLGATAATAMAALSPTAFGAAHNNTSTNKSRSVVVIGAGIVGASIAWHLSKRGCEVTVLEAKSPACQASGNSFAWINASYAKLPFSYHLLSNYAMHEYHRLSEQLPLPLHWGGCLEWMGDTPAQAAMVREIEKIQAFGSPTSMVARRQAQALAPAVNFGDTDQVAYCALDGTVDARAATETLLADAQKAGTKIVYPAPVTGISRISDKLVIQSGAGEFAADQVVVAAGTGASQLANITGMQLEQRSTPGIIVTTEPMPAILEPIIVAPGVHIHQRKDGRVVIGEQAGAPSTDAHRSYLQGFPNRHPTPELAQQHAARILDIGKRFLPDLSEATVEEVGIGWRPLPMDGLPVVGRHPQEQGLYFAVMHSGVTLAPIVGRLAATELLDDVSISLLTDFRPDRLSA
ncbi:MAG: FAD-dependent oxidoreductase [Halieaceae bacterium]